MFLWFKAFHVVSVFAWMAGMFYLPRLFVYHEIAAVGSEASELFKVMERRLLRAIMGPAAGASWVFGACTAWSGGFLAPLPGWLIVKIGAVVVLTGLHVVLGRFAKEFREDRRGRGVRYYRVVNEVPTVLLVIIVVMVVLQPSL